MHDTLCMCRLTNYDPTYINNFTINILQVREYICIIELAVDNI